MTNLTGYVESEYMANKDAGSQDWTDINMNIKTAVAQTMKEGWSEPVSGVNDTFWDSFLINDYETMSR